MNITRINEQMENRKYPVKYTYIIGHGFGVSDHKAEIIGRFGTTVEAESHIERINNEVKSEGGCLAFKSEFPFLILEILTIEFEKDKEKAGIPFKFYSFDWEKVEYVESRSVNKDKVLEEYKSRSKSYMEKLNELDELEDEENI